MAELGALGVQKFEDVGGECADLIGHACQRLSGEGLGFLKSFSGVTTCLEREGKKRASPQTFLRFKMSLNRAFQLGTPLTFTSAQIWVKEFSKILQSSPIIVGEPEQNSTRND